MIRNKECDKCWLSEQSSTICLMNEPKKEYPLMIVSDYPANVDSKDGTVFESAKERLLIGVLKQVLKVDFGDVYFTYLTKCRPADDNSPGRESMEACMDYLYQEIEEVNPKVIVPLGAVVLSAFTDEKIKENRGKFIEVDIKGTVRVLCPVYSPGFVERQDALMIVFAEDLQKAYNRAIDMPMDKQYVPTTVVTTMRDVRKLFEWVETTGVCCFDFETTGTNTFVDNFMATGLALSFQVGHAYFIPLYHSERCFTDDEIKVVFDLLSEVMSDVNNRSSFQHFHVPERYHQPVGIWSNM